MNTLNAPNVKPIKNCELVELKVANTSNSRIYFPINENLKDKKIVGVETFKVANVAKSPVGNAIINATAVKDAYVTLNADGREKVKDIPLSAFDVANNAGFIKNMDGLNINLQKSYVSFAQTSNLVANEAIVFAFYYE